MDYCDLNYLNKLVKMIKSFYIKLPKCKSNCFEHLCIYEFHENPIYIKDAALNHFIFLASLIILDRSRLAAGSLFPPCILSIF